MKIAKSSLVKLRVLTAIGAASVLIGAMPASAVTYIQGFDVYKGDGTVTWTTARNGGYQFAFVKATEGVNFVDDNFATNMSGANAVNQGGVSVPAFYVGPYHLARPDSKNLVPWTSYDGGPFAYNSPTQTNRDAWLDATSEAADFIDAIRPYYYQTGNTFYLPPVADVELSKIPDFGNTNLEKTFVSNWIQVFSDAVYDALGVRPLMYLSKSNANTYWTSTIASQHKLWLAQWKGTGTTSPPVQSDTPLWPAWSFWQWSDGTDAIAQANQVPGTVVSVDRDVFSGTLQQLDALTLQLVQGDYNHNNTVDAGDYVTWRKEMSLPTAKYNAYSVAFLGADGNSSNKVDAADYTYWRARYGKTLSGSGSGSELDSFGVPEPATIALLCCGGLFAMFGRARR